MGSLVTVVSILVVLASFAAGALVGWMWWGRRVVSSRLGRDEALDVVQERLGVDLLAMDDEIARLRYATPGSGMSR